MPVYTLFFDGCSKGNPGRSGAGAVIYCNVDNNEADNNKGAGDELWAEASFVGVKETNNVAEYTGLIRGLERAVEIGIRRLTVKGDSKLIIEQMKGAYQVKSANLMLHYSKAKKLASATNFDKIDFIHVYRNENKRADELSNQGLLIV